MKGRKENIHKTLKQSKNFSSPIYKEYGGIGKKMIGMRVIPI